MTLRKMRCIHERTRPIDADCTILPMSRYYHKIGTPQSEDILVYLDEENPLHSPGTKISDDGKYLLLSITRDCENVNMLYIANLEETGSIVPRDHKWTKVVDNFKAHYS